VNGRAGPPLGGPSRRSAAERYEVPSFPSPSIRGRKDGRPSLPAEGRVQSGAPALAVPVTNHVFCRLGWQVGTWERIGAHELKRDDSHDTPNRGNPRIPFTPLTYRS
jgi:hypothetical protein